MKRKKLSAAEEEKLSSLAPMWQRIARGEVDLSQYSDDEILSGRIKMADGRKTPPPKVLPETFIQEQVKRGMRVAERKIRQGADKALDVYTDILEDDKASRADRMKAADFFINRRFGKEPVTVKVAAEDKIQSLFEQLLDGDDGLLPEQED